MAERYGYLRSKRSGRPITAEVDTLIAYANFSRVTQDADGSIEPDWSGESDLDWDSQRADCSDDGRVWYVDDQGDPVPADECEFIEGDPDDADTDEDADEGEGEGARS